ncbi:MAG: hypothetical protein C5B51_17445 [Terriglobia bacterium]|nr:MAG: hypothetical protein C5B51_17445 [Terriglobia bacterium]
MGIKTYDAAMLQVGHLTTRQSPSNTAVVDMGYSYTAGQNNGRTSQSTDGVVGETVNYTYDSLNRLATAQPLCWSVPAL